MTAPTKGPLALTPGAPRAKDAGCLCPVIDNRYGHGYGMSANGPLYVIHEGCPMHGTPDPLRVACPYCYRQPGYPCRAMTTGRECNAHTARVRAAKDADRG